MREHQDHYRDAQKALDASKLSSFFVNQLYIVTRQHVSGCLWC